MIDKTFRRKPGWTDGYRHCCHLTCEQKAKFRITFPPYLYDDYVDCCGDHVRELIGDSTEDRVAKL